MPSQHCFVKRKPMKRIFLLFLLPFLLFGLMFAIALYVPASLPVHSDFSAIYNTNLALVNGVPIYDLEAVEAMAVKASGLPPEKFFLARFPYPPWYALSTFYLGFLPVKVAATLWFELNLFMLFLSIWLLTDGWNERMRLIAFPLALTFIPVLGTLSVGQYDFPVLLGTSLLVYALQRENIILTTLGAVLLTFKPHIGALVLLATLVWLIQKGGAFKRHAIHSMLIAGFFLFIASFIADPTWIVSYPKMLLGYQGEGNVALCSECASLPVWFSRWFFDGSLATAALIAVLLLSILVGIFFTRRNALSKTPEFLLTAALLMTLLASPYLYNYDFILLLVPFAILAREGTLIQRIVIIFCYLVPTLAIALYGREGNISLLAATLVMGFLLYVRMKNGMHSRVVGSVTL